MTNRYKKSVYSKLPPVESGEYAEVLSVYTDDDGNQAVVPPGWTVSGLKKENTIWGKNKSLVIYRIPKEKAININWESPGTRRILKENYDQFVWNPVRFLKPNGTLDGLLFVEEFGRRKYLGTIYYEELEGELMLQVESIKKYGGYYFTRYSVSKDKNTGKPRSVKGQMPWICINKVEAEKQAALIEDSGIAKTHLTFGAEFDTVIQWFIDSKTRTFEDVSVDSTKWGNYNNKRKAFNRLVETGSWREGCTNNVYGFTGNVHHWTQECESKGSSYCIVRNGYYNEDGRSGPASRRFYEHYSDGYFNIGFCATLYIK